MEFTNKLLRAMYLLCRVCLACNIRKYRMTTDDLRFYENLANTKMDSNDGMPKAMCYICYALLRKCQRFSNMAHKSEKILNDLLINQFEVTPEAIAKLPIMPTQLLAVNHNKVVITFKSSKKYQKTVQQEFVDYQKHSDEHLNMKLNTKMEIDASDNGTWKTSNDLKQKSLGCDLSDYRDKSFACGNLNQDNHLTSKLGCDNQEGITELPQTKTPMGEKSYSCDKCEKHFTQAAQLQNHKRIQHGINPYTCDLCSDTFRYKKVLQKHYSMAHKEGLRVSKQLKMVKHIPMRIIYQCNYCDKKFSKDSYLTNHKKTSHKVNKPHKCHQCNITFNSKTMLKEHNLSIHKETQVFVCDKCPKTFKLMGTLKLHMRTHTGEKPHVCKFCDKQFSQKIVLLDHTNRIHSMMKPYACKNCDKRFPAQSDLRTHNRIIHLRDKPFVCDICGNRFSMRCNLRSHLKVHTGERPFSCANCDQKFTHNNGLKRHMERIHSLKIKQNNVIM